jgi:hypothetical protein
MPSTHMSGVPKGSQNQGPPGTSMKASTQSPASPSALTDSGGHPAVPKGSANQGPAATSTKNTAQNPTGG